MERIVFALVLADFVVNTLQNPGKNEGSTSILRSFFFALLPW